MCARGLCLEPRFVAAMNAVQRGTCHLSQATPRGAVGRQRLHQTTHTLNGSECQAPRQVGEVLRQLLQFLLALRQVAAEIEGRFPGMWIEAPPR